MILIKQLLKSTVMLSLLGLVFYGCVNTELVYKPESDTVSVRFDVELPNVSTPTTRGTQTQDEAVVNNFYVLLFDKSDKFIEKKVVLSSSFTSETSGSGSTAKEIKSFSVSLLRSKDASDLFNIVLLANVADGLKTAVDAIAAGADRETVLATLTQTYTGNPSMPVPMSSVPKSSVKIESGMATQTFNMIRMVARIDVKLASAVTADYSVKRVLLYNYNTIGRVWTNSFSGTKATGVTLPSNPGTAPAHSSYAVSNTRSAGLALTDFEGLLYAQEASVNSASNRPCVVVELEDKTGISVGHYRADFLSASGTPKYLDLLRNHRYQVNITQVYSNGFVDPDDAYKSTPVGLVATVIDWDEANMKNIEVSGNYWISVSARDLGLNFAAQTDASIEVTTNVQSGWSVEGVYDDAACTTSTTVGWITDASKSGDNLSVTVTENGSTVRTAYVKLKAGTVQFTIKVVQNVKPVITVSPSSLLLPYTGVTAATDNLSVTCTSGGIADPTATWTLTSTDSWLTIGLQADGSDAGATVSGIGDQTVYTFATVNPDASNRTTTITLNGTIDVVVNITQLPNPSSLNGLWVTGAYVGAFWRDDQTGERVIDMNAATPVNTKWRAYVAWMDDRWNDGDIVLSLDGSSDPNILTLSPGDAESYPVGGNATVIESKSNTPADRLIKFRIGLKSTYNSNDTYPARYAVVVISFGENYNSHMKLYLRQGHNPDYVFRFGEKGPDGVSQTRNRVSAVKFSAYNLTHPDFKKNLGGSIDVPSNPRIPLRSTIATSDVWKYFTDYPTQAGAHFFWADDQYSRVAMHPTAMAQDGTSTSLAMRWPTLVPQEVWGNLVDVETCPPGFRRPQMNGTSDFVTNTSTKYPGDFEASLIYDEKDATKNRMAGFYADGYFDRRELQYPKGLITSSTIKTAVNRSATTVAYRGVLLFNPTTMQSLFLPSAGVIQNDYVASWQTGYWTSAVGYFTTTNQYGVVGIYWALDNSAAGQSRYKPWSMPIRCVVE